MVIIRNQNKITDFFMLLAWASPFNKGFTIIHFPAIFLNFMSSLDEKRGACISYNNDVFNSVVMMIGAT